jgi:hypothetical protein
MISGGTARNAGGSYVVLFPLPCFPYFKEQAPERLINLILPRVSGKSNANCSRFFADPGFSARDIHF